MGGIDPVFRGRRAMARRGAGSDRLPVRDFHRRHFDLVFQMVMNSNT